MLVIAHRGASSLEPENTIRSFKKAEEVGADMIEFDVRETADGELVLNHDATLRRVFKHSNWISRTSLGDIKRITREAGREMPTLGEALAVINKPIDVHVKVHGIEQKLVRQLKGFSSKVLISSTYPGVLKKIRALDENVDLGLIIGKGELHLLFLLRYLTRQIKLYSIHPKYVLVNALSIAALRTLGPKLIVWSVNQKHEFERIKKLNVDGVITDVPQVFKK